MEKKYRPLSELEQIFKKQYLNGGEAYLKRPISIAEFLTFAPERKTGYDNISNYHEPVSTNNPGNTIIEPDELDIEVVLHQRYSYPIMHNHQYIELTYVAEGTCVNYVENQAIKMEKGDVCIMAPDAMHAIAVDSDDTLVMNLIMCRRTFDVTFMNMLKGGKEIASFIEHILFNKKVSPYMIFKTGTDQDIIGLISQIYEEQEKKPFLYKESVYLLVRLLFVMLIRKYEVMAIVSNPLENMPDHNAMALMAYISINYNTTTLSELANFFGYNENYLGKMIFHYTGKKFNDLIADIQIDKAKELLGNSNMSITEVATEVGCYDSSHFNRKFKKLVGCSPKEYRNSEMKKM